MTTGGLLPCKNDGKVFALDEVLAYIVSVGEQVHKHPQKPEGCTEMSEMLFSHSLVYR